MQPLRSSEQNGNEMTISSDKQVTNYFSAANYSRAISENEHKPEASTIKEAESSLQANVSLNSEVHFLTILHEFIKTRTIGLS